MPAPHAKVATVPLFVTLLFASRQRCCLWILLVHVAGLFIVSACLGDVEGMNSHARREAGQGELA